MLLHRRTVVFLLLLHTAISKADVSVIEFRAHQAPLQNVLYVGQPGAPGVVVLAGRNALYKLSADSLSLQATYTTGPKEDSLLCPPHGLHCDSQSTATDNDNQVLLLVGFDHGILACGTIYQGICSIHHLWRNLEVTQTMNKSLTANYIASRSSTSAFFGSGWYSNVIFVASAHDGRPPDYGPHLLSSRVLKTSGNFEIRSFTRDVTPLLKKNYRARYVHGFSYNDFAYFVVVQNKGASHDTFETRLVRVCESDTSFQTYTELPIKCRKKNGPLSHYGTISISASLQHSATGTSNRTGVLAVAFGTPFGGRWDMNDQSLGSELCFFDMDRVETAFREIVESCNKGTSKAGLSIFFHDESDLKCKQTGQRGNICEPSMNNYIEGLEPLIGTATAEFKEGLATSVTVMEQNGVTVAWVGDNEGYLHKVVRNGDSSKLLYWTDLSKGERTPIEKSTALDNDGAFGYFLTGDKVLKFPVGSCSIYGTCSKCLRSQEDPLGCGWCAGRCAHAAECPQGTRLAFDRCPIEVYNVRTTVTPTSGPTSGGTMLTVLGDNFGYWWRESSNSIKITIGGRVCQIINWVFTLVKCRTPPVQDASKVDVVISVNDTSRDTKKNYDVIGNLTIPLGFEYKVAKLSGVVPDYGPVAGGTNVTLLGENLDIGSQRAVMIGGAPCKLYMFNQTSVQCWTTAAPADHVDMEEPVNLAIDGVNIASTSEHGHGFTFRFMPNPVIERISPTAGPFSEQPAIRANGVNFESVFKPTMVTRVASLDSKKQESIVTACRVLEKGRTLLCPGPSLTEFSVISGGELHNHTTYILAKISFQLDGLHLPAGSTNTDGYFTFAYRLYPPSDTSRIGNPATVAKLTEVLPCYGPVAGGTNITLRGTNFDIGSQRLVTIGETPCSINRVGNAFLECTTSPVSVSQARKKMRVSLKLSGDEVPFDSNGNLCSTFTYKPDPEINDIAPKAATPGGASVIEAQGKHLDSVSTPLMVTRVSSLDKERQAHITMACRVVEGGQKMHCPRASLIESSVISSAELAAQDLPIVVQISFRMDGLHLPRKSANEETYFNFTYEPERRIVPISETRAEEEGTIAKAMHATEIIATFLAAFIIIILLVALWVFYCRHRTRNPKETSCEDHLKLRSEEDAAHSLLNTGLVGSETTGGCSCPSRVDAQASKLTQVQLIIHSSQLEEDIKAMLQDRNLLIERKDLLLGPVIGNGHFGCVHQGTLQIGSERNTVKVAVKTLLQNYAASKDGRDTFLREALIMKDFCHPNVLQLLGLTVDEKNGLMVITPYMEHGDLRSYLLDETKVVKLLDILAFSLHVAKGMKYLTEKKLVHRDLAARNCMLSEDLVVRVADFGLSRAIYEKEYYMDRNSKTRLPIRWMAPESLEKCIYNHKTDVWAYGVLLWELMTRGMVPYPHVANWDIPKFLKQGLRMQQPKFCPDQLYQVMLQCWHQDPTKRPTFANLVADITLCTMSLKKRKRNTIVSLDAGYAKSPHLGDVDTTV